MRLRHPGRFEVLVCLKGTSRRRLAEQAQLPQAFISLVSGGRHNAKATPYFPARRPSAVQVRSTRVPCSCRSRPLAG
ncbi:hypothetical protein ACFY2W_34450 [Streptomyces sp. NPDC001262]|uniref:hypothetical protein n=1 Tax=unclassified Streptomyces TaxID=2593676 RepID=UPI003687C993